MAAYVPLTGVSKLWEGSVSYHSCALTSSGGVLCWGYNQFGGLGDNSTTGRKTPVAVTGLSSGVTALAEGNSHTCALTSSGGVLCWGRNNFGQLGDNSTTNSLTPVAVTGLSSGVIALATGHSHTCAVTSSGGVLCWGNNSSGQLGDNSTTNRWTPVAVSGLSSGVIALATGYSYTCALTGSGGVLCWGDNTDGQLGDNSVTTRKTPVVVSGLSSGVVAIAAGSSHTCALISSGGVLCWGYNQYGSLGDNSTTQRLTPVAVSGLSSGVTALAAGYFHICALTSSGGVLCWGDNSSGQLGDNSTTNRWTPVAVSGLSSGVTAIAPGAFHTCALISSSGVQCWGDNGVGQLGDNSTTMRFTPVDVLVGTLPTATSVSLSLNPSGTPTWQVLEVLKGNYTYSDAEAEVESGTTFQWYQATDSACSAGKTAIAGATAQTYTVVSGDVGKYLCFGVTPKNANGTGTEVLATSSSAITKVDQTITFSPSTTATYVPSGTLALTASSTSGLTVTLASTTPGVCTVSGTTLTMVTAGTCTVTANQAGNTNYNAAPQVSANITLNKAGQTITFNALASKTYGNAAFLVSATTSSGLAVSFSASGNCTVAGSTVAITGGGSCTITANQAGDANYNAATAVPQTFTIAKANQTITFNALASKIYGDAAFPVSATASSSLAVSFGASGNCTVAGSTVTITDGGSCTITANQAGDTNYNAATGVPQAFTIAKATQTISFSPAANGAYGESATLSANAISGLTVTFASTTPSVCTASGPTLNYLSAGTCTVTVDQAGDANYLAAPQVSGTITVTPASQTLTFTLPTEKATMGDTPLTLTATGGPSGNPVTFASTTPEICTVNETTLTLVSVGTCTITADQAGNANYLAALQVSQNLTINPVPVAETPAVSTSTLLPNQLALLVRVDGSGHGSVRTDTGLFCTRDDCPTDSQGNLTCNPEKCRAMVDTATTVTLTLEADKDSVFSSWGGNEDCVNGEVFMNGSKLCIAFFHAIQELTVVTMGTGNVIAHDYGYRPQGIDCGNGGTDCSELFSQGTTTFLQATPATGMTFLGWGGDCQTLPNPLAAEIKVGVSTEMTCEAWFGAVGAPLPVVKADQTLNFSPALTAAVGVPLTLTATGGSSGNPVTFASTTPAICTVADTTLSFLTHGSCTVTADQAGNDQYQATPTVTATLTVLPCAGLKEEGNGLILSKSCDAKGYVFSKLMGINAGVTLKNAVIANTVSSKGTLAGNTTIEATGVVDGGTLADAVTNKGTVKNFTFTGRTFSGGTVGGKITINSKFGGCLSGVEKASDAKISGGTNGGICSSSK